MTRKLKALGLTLVAVFALSAAAVSTASAQQGKLTSDGPVTLDMTEISGLLNGTTAFGGVITCAGSTWTGHAELTTNQTGEGKTHGLISSGATAITLTEDINQPNCKVVEGGTTHKATVTMNGCDYVLRIGNTIIPGLYAVSTDIVCPPNKHIEKHVYAFAGSELGGVACTITVKAQSGRTGPTLKNTKFQEIIEGNKVETEDLDIEGTFKEITLSKSGFGCSTAEEASGEFHFNVTVTGTSEVKHATDITVTD